MKRHPWLTGLAAFLLLAGLTLLGRHKFHFNFDLFGSQLARADWSTIMLAVGCVYAGIVVRSMRWLWLLRHSRKVPLISLLGAQMIGFAAVALFGRLADVTRPYLVAKKAALPVSLQASVFVIERLFDAGILALLFSGAIFLSDAQSEFLRKAALTAGVGTLIGMVFVVALRLAGDEVANFFARLFSFASEKVGIAVGEKLRIFHAGLDAMRSFFDLVVVVALSAILWGLIAAAYFMTSRAFVADPQLSMLTFWQCVPLLAVSSGASFVQLPVLGWFSQIGIVAAGMSAMYHVPAEVSTAWSATLLLATFLSPLPVGLIWAQAEGINLLKVTAEAEHDPRSYS